MDWVKLPTRIGDDPRLRALNDAAEVMFTRGICLAAECDSDGFIPTALVHHLARRHRAARRSAQRLVSAGLWSAVDGGFHVVDWESFRPRALTRAHIPDAVRFAVYERDGYTCVFCVATEPLSLDHIWPWSLGGSDDAENLQTLCIPCNIRKGVRV